MMGFFFLKFKDGEIKKNNNNTADFLMGHPNSVETLISIPAPPNCFRHM